MSGVLIKVGGPERIVSFINVKTHVRLYIRDKHFNNLW